MVTVEKAKALIEENIFVLRKERVHLLSGLGGVLAEDVFAPISLPLFRQSSVDGFGIRSKGQKPGTTFSVKARIKAGDYLEGKLLKGEAFKILTGARVPEGVDAIVKQEEVTAEDDKITIHEPLVSGQNIIPAGAQIKKGELALKKGTVLSPASLGFLSALGIDTVSVIRKPTVTIITTGNELQKPGKSIKPAQVYDANSTILHAALLQAGISEIDSVLVNDDFEILHTVISKALRRSDMILISGGISVGDYDFTKAALLKNKVKEIFHKVSQKPGKPLFFGTRGRKLIFGLPGNPGSLLTCFYEYVYSALRKMSANNDAELQLKTAPLLTAWKKPEGISCFLKGLLLKNGVEPLKAQESYSLLPFTQANCLIYLPQGITQVSVRETVEVHLIPQN